jgi:hypothetical protein
VFKITLKTDLPEQLRQARQNLEKTLPSLLQQVGEYVLTEQRYSFESKSKGGGGADGQPWLPLKPSTEIKKASKKKGFRNKRARVGKLKKQLRTATTKEQRSRIFDKLKKATTAAAVPKSQIGVDTGLLRNSGRKGYAGPDGKGGNVFQVTGNQVVMEYGRSYAGYFDEKRPLFPAQAPQAWMDGIDAIVRDWIDEQTKGIR